MAWAVQNALVQACRMVQDHPGWHRLKNVAFAALQGKWALTPGPATQGPLQQHSAQRAWTPTQGAVGATAEVQIASESSSFSVL